MTVQIAKMIVTETKAAPGRGKDVRDGNSYCSRERQTNKWLTRRVQEFHPSAFRLSGLGKASRNRAIAITKMLKVRGNVQLQRHPERSEGPPNQSQDHAQYIV